MADLGCSPSEFVFTSGTTAGLNLIAHCAGEQLNKGDVVVLSVMEHHAHLVPWQMVAKQKGLEIKIVHVDENGRISLSHLENILKEGRVRIVGFPLISNVLGTVQPVAEIVALAKETYGARIVVAAQGLGLKRLMFRNWVLMHLHLVVIRCTDVVSWAICTVRLVEYVAALYDRWWHDQRCL